MYKWTRERPQAPGFYFARFDAEPQQPFILEARAAKHTPKQVMDLWQGPFLLVDLGLQGPVEFAGPIPLPER